MVASTARDATGARIREPDLHTLPHSHYQLNSSTSTISATPIRTRNPVNLLPKLLPHLKRLVLHIQPTQTRPLSAPTKVLHPIMYRCSLRTNSCLLFSCNCCLQLSRDRLYHTNKPQLPTLSSLRPFARFHSQNRSRRGASLPLWLAHQKLSSPRATSNHTAPELR